MAQLTTISLDSIIIVSQELSIYIFSATHTTGLLGKIGVKNVKYVCCKIYILQKGRVKITSRTTV